LAEEMAFAWRRGNCPLAEEFLARYPELCVHPEAAVRLIYEEVCLRQELGQEMSSVELIHRFPRWRAELEALLDCHRLLQSGPVALNFPRPGEALGDFCLLAELGRGGLGRVFLATQPSLSNRPVVLKLTPRDGSEHLTLARLQHTHIVPLYSVQDFPDPGLRAICMPYLGGASLGRLLEMLHDQPPEQRAGVDLLEAIDRLQRVVPVALPAGGRDRRFLERATYAQAVCWIGAYLASALQYAHERGLVHLDLKPSNVLLAADGQPMLLDFHLARGPICPGRPAPKWLGGTPGYMSPEQQSALAAARQGQPIPAAVDDRSDIYSLGLILYEMLGGEVPFSTGPTRPRLTRHNRQVTVGLADIIDKCLTRDPRGRYPDAAALADDLRRHLADAPLCGVANRSLAERWRKWRRRRPHALPLAGMLLTVLTATLITGDLVVTRVGQRLHAGRAALIDGREEMRKGRYSEAVRTLMRGRALSEGLPGSRDLTHALESQLHLARQAEAARGLHLVADRLRFLYGIEFLPIGEMRALEARCHTIWEARSRLLERRGAELMPEDEQRIPADLLDLAILWTDLRVRLAPEGEASRARHEALRVLMEAESMVLVPGPVLYRERQAHAEALGLTSMARAAARHVAEQAPRTAWEHYALGQSLLRSGELERASTEFEQALDLEPQDFWPNFYQGVCAYRLRRYRDAASAFRVCIALTPASAECFYNRALASTALGQTDRALRDYDHALRLDPTLAVAALNRGILYSQERRYAEAIADFERALNAGADPMVIRNNLALVSSAEKNRSDAR
jgi:tetratricopeptide (TPR) repeat protein